MNDDLYFFYQRESIGNGKGMEDCFSILFDDTSCGRLNKAKQSKASNQQNYLQNGFFKISYFTFFRLLYDPM